MLQTFIYIVHVFVCMVLMGVVLLQQGKGGGMGAAFGGATTQVFGGRGAGNILTRATAICAGIFMLTSVSLAYLSSSGDRALKAKVTQEAGRKKDKGQLKERAKDAEPTPAPTETPAPTGDTPAPTEAPAPTAPAP
ncbi:MAG: preprotein translocase subunit SecG [Myxococcales bacterium 68-20]|nr:preprotein translocase subunit SecG [Myxococcales bacterium]OJY28086.1 MAG: preprotein translocase subunit SecG [Myxococcales bacterium 68-20]